VHCDLGTASLRPNASARLFHDGEHWQLWGLKSNTRLAWFRSDDVQSIQVIDSTRLERRTPDWAMALGIALLPCFLIGLVFFFAKETVRVQAAVVELTLTTGEVVALEVWNEFVATLQEALRT
jgi:hypothetical protein